MNTNMPIFILRSSVELQHFTHIFIGEKKVVFIGFVFLLTQRETRQQWGNGIFLNCIFVKKKTFSLLLEICVFGSTVRMAVILSLSL